uniref:Reverse transcriptase domain-containing protein n=1 Tax=Macrostomum lignano TaxID=282301 RepID=A0A1I8HJM6_9PLAT
ATRDQIKREISRGMWRCPPCSKAASLSPPSPTGSDPTIPRRGRSAPGWDSSKPTLTILQWNADGICNKMGELEELAQRLQVDIITVQESKLMSLNRTPKLVQAISPFARTANIKGGGLLLFVRQGIPYRKIQGWNGGTTEGSRIVVNTSARDRLIITNIYRPPIRRIEGEDHREHPSVDSWLRCHHREIITGDFNLHHPSWGSDADQGRDSLPQSRCLINWCSSTNYRILNSGAHTCIDRHSGRSSAPDLSIASQEIAPRCTWSTLNELGSDHKPILISISTARDTLRATPRFHWAWKKADWSQFRSILEEDCEHLNRGSIKKQVSRLTKGMLKAAELAIPRKKVSIRNKPYWDDELSKLRDHRNALREAAAPPRNGALKARSLSSAAAKRNMNFGRTLSEKWPNPRTPKSNGKQAAHPNENLVVDGKELCTDKDKANAFGRYYEDISTLKHDATHRKFKVQTATRLASYEADDDNYRRDFTEEQVARLVQAIQDGWERNPHLKTLAVLIDCSRAFDRVWRARLLARMMDEGLPACMVKWFDSFLEGRQIAVRIGATTGKWRRLREGVPQGAVSSPALFLLYVNAWSDYMTANVEYSGYADDIALWTTGRDIRELLARTQDALQKIEQWADHLRIDLNPSKTECCLYSRDRADRDRALHLSLNGHSIPSKKELKFLGVWIDHGLLFDKHSNAVKEKMARRTAIIRALAHREWGWDRALLLRVYRALVESVVWHAAAAWTPWLSSTRLDDLDRAQREALRAITGLPRSTPVEAIYMETNVSPISLEARRRALMAYEKSKPPPGRRS